jgi:hypothetical protein
LHFQEPQQVGQDGTLFVPLGCVLDPSKIMVALSHDEGLTWNYVKVPIGDVGNGSGIVGGVSIAMDEAGALYVLWPGTDKRPYMSVTKDQGATWKGPFMVGAPGVITGTPSAQIAAREPGHVAIAYYGYEKGKKETELNGYLTESFDASSQDPLFHSAMLNDPKDPLYFPVKSGTLPRNDYLGVTIAPDGTPWTGLVKLLSNEPDKEGFIRSTGFVGRLVAPARSAGRRVLRAYPF